MIVIYLQLLQKLRTSQVYAGFGLFPNELDGVWFEGEVSRVKLSGGLVVEA